MISRKVDIKRLEEDKAEMESTIKSNESEYKDYINKINADECEIEELESEVSTMKHNIECMKTTVKELIEFNKDDKKKLADIISKLNLINGVVPKQATPWVKERPSSEATLGNFGEKKMHKMFKSGNPIVVPICDELSEDAKHLIEDVVNSGRISQSLKQKSC